MKKVSKRREVKRKGPDRRIFRGKNHLAEVEIFNNGYVALDCYLKTREGPRAATLGSAPGSSIIWTWGAYEPGTGPWTLTVKRAFPNDMEAGKPIACIVDVREIIPARYIENTWKVE